MGKIGTTELLIVLAIVLVIFGPKALPKLGRSLGKTLGSFKKGLKDDEEDDGEYKYTKYTDDGGNIVKVTYENGTFFILNYNFFDVTVVLDGTTYTIARNGGVKVTPDGNSVYFTAND